MFTISTIELLKEEKAYAWNIVFTLNEQKMKYATDIIYAVRRNRWIANSFITHELSSIMEGETCPQCNRDQIACLTLCGQHVEVTKAIISDPKFHQLMTEQVDGLFESNFPTHLEIVKNQDVWNEIIYENTTEKILKRQ